VSAEDAAVIASLMAEEEAAMASAVSSSTSGLSLEERKQRVQDKLLAKKAAKAEAAKLEARARELERREAGKKARVTKEAMETAAREKRAAERKKEAAFKAAQKQRVQLQLLQDKLDRFRTAGKTAEAEKVAADILAVREGRKPAGAAGGASSSSVSWTKRQDMALASLQRADLGGGSRGLTALKTVRALVANATAADRGGQAGEAGARYRRIRVDNGAFRSRVADVPGGRQMLQASGWGAVKAADADERGLRGPAAIEAYAFAHDPFGLEEATALSNEAVAKLAAAIAAQPA
jgi:hypothetical protein